MGKITMQELKKAVSAIEGKYKVSSAVASKIVGSIREDGEQVYRIIGGDFSAVPMIAKKLGYTLTDSETDGPKQSEGKKKREKKEEKPEKIEAEVIRGEVGEGLPPDLLENINGWILEYCKANRIEDPNKIDQRQWNAVCIYIGEHIKQTGMLRDREREAHEGGKIYKGEKLEEMLYVFEYVCSAYKQTAFRFLFPKFAGISRQFFHDYQNRGLTSSGVQLAKKAEEIQNESIMNGIASGGGNAVPFIFLGKSVVGLQETTTVQHVSISAQTPTVEALPNFGQATGIEEKAEEN